MPNKKTADWVKPYVEEAEADVIKLQEGLRKTQETDDLEVYIDPVSKNVIMFRKSDGGFEAFHPKEG